MTLSFNNRWTGTAIRGKDWGVHLVIYSRLFNYDPQMMPWVIYNPQRLQWYVEYTRSSGGVGSQNVWAFNGGPLSKGTDRSWRGKSWGVHDPSRYHPPHPSTCLSPMGASSLTSPAPSVNTGGRPSSSFETSVFVVGTRVPDFNRLFPSSLMPGVSRIIQEKNLHISRIITFYNN